MLRKLLPAGLVLASVLMMSECGGSSKATPPAVKSALFTLITDTPLCDVLGLHLQVTSLTLTPQGGGSTVTVFPPSVTVNPNFLSPKIEVSSLKDFTTILNLEQVNVGTYDQATIVLTETTASVYDPSQPTGFSVLPVTQTQSSTTVSINPPLVITNGSVSALRLDFDLPASLQLSTNTQGALVGSVTPVLHATPLTASASTGFGEMDDLEGFVESVTPSIMGSPQGFIGSFQLQMLSGNGPSLTVDITNPNQLCGATCPLGITNLKQLLTGSFVETDAFLDSQGNVVAMPDTNANPTVEVEYPEVVSDKKVAYLGTVLSATRDSAGNLTQFNMIVRETEPDDSAEIILDHGAIVNVSSSTTFSVASPVTNFASLDFGPAAIVPGQEVAVHGVFTPPPSGTSTTSLPITVAADSIFLRLQTLQGNFISLVQVGSDDKTGAFELASCGTVFQSASVMVITANELNGPTTFLGVAGLSELTPQPTLLVKGLTFLEPQATTINGVKVLAGTLVMLAKQVHQP